MRVSWNRGTPKSSSISNDGIFHHYKPTTYRIFHEINHPVSDSPFDGKLRMISRASAQSCRTAGSKRSSWRRSSMTYATMGEEWGDNREVSIVMGVPPVIIHFERWDYPWHKPSISGSPISGKPHLNMWENGCGHFPGHPCYCLESWAHVGASHSCCLKIPNSEYDWTILINCYINCIYIYTCNIHLC